MEEFQNTLKTFLDQHLHSAVRIQVLTGSVSVSALDWLLTEIPRKSCLSVIATSIRPELKAELDLFFREGPSTAGTVGHSLENGRLRLGFHCSDYMKVWLLTLNDRTKSSYLTVMGNTDLTWASLQKGKGKQNNHSTGYGRFLLEESRWKRFVPETRWLTRYNWADLRNQNWKYPAQSTPRSWLYSETYEPLSVEETQQVISEFFEINLEDLKCFSRKHPSTIKYAYQQIEMYLEMEMYFQGTLSKTTLIH